MVEALEQVSHERPFVYINLFSVSEEATIDELWDVFRDYDIADIIRNQSISSLYDLKLKSREEFLAIISKPKYFAGKRPFFLRFSQFIRQSKHSP